MLGTSGYVVLTAIGIGGIAVMLVLDAILTRERSEEMQREYHVAAVGGSDDSEVSVDLADVLNALGAQDWELTTAVPLKDSDTLLLILSREKQPEIRT